MGFEALVGAALLLLTRILFLLILIRCILSWFPISNTNPIKYFFIVTTEPMLAPIRALFNKSPINSGGSFIDFSPVIAGFLLYFIQIIIMIIFKF